MVPGRAPGDGSGDLARAWRAARPPAAGVHLDSASCSRQGLAAIDAAAAHARHEAEVGGYVAAEAAEPVLSAGRAAIGALTGFAAADVHFTTGSSHALDVLLRDWTGPRTAACLPGEYGPNLAALARHGFTTTLLPVDGVGRLDVDAAATALAAQPPGLVHLTALASHRGIVQPAGALGAACAALGVPMLVDAAQAFSHVDCAGMGASPGTAAIYGSSRKWTAGPRGVGFLAVRPGLLAEEATQRLDDAEANAAAQVGFAVALGEYLAAGPDAVRRGLAAGGAAARAALGGLPGWRVLEPAGEPCAIATAEPPEDVDVPALRDRLLAERGVLVTHLAVARAPQQMTRPALRVSPHLDVTDADLAALVAGIAELS